MDRGNEATVYESKVKKTLPVTGRKSVIFDHCLCSGIYVDAIPERTYVFEKLHLFDYIL